ncbi:MAG: hypothetical protein ACXQS8_05015 [Candidatus Helarchaeales archaeon]
MTVEFDRMIAELEGLFEQLLTRDNTPDQEVSYKMSMLKLLSSIRAYAEVKAGPASQELVRDLDSLNNKLVEWDPFGPWFKEVKDLVSLVQKVITGCKKLKFEETIPAAQRGGVLNATFNAFQAKIEKELEIVRKELAEIKTVLKSVIKGEIPRPSKTVQKPIAVKPAASQPAKTTPRPKPTPVEIPKTPAKPKPKPVELPQPVPITEPPVSKPKSKPTAKPTAQKKPPQPSEPQDKSERLFGLFSPNLGPTPRPPISSANNSTPVKPAPVPLPKTTPKPVPIPEPATPATPEVEETDSEKLYQELVALEGKRFALEMGIRDIKQKYESGEGITEEEYKRALEEKLEELKQISSRIDKIREKLD